METPTAPAPSTPAAEPTTILGGDPTPPAAPATPSAPTQSPWAGADGSFSEGWLDRLPPELADAKPTLGKYKSVAELGKAHHSLQQVLGKHGNMIAPLTDKSTPEEVAAYRKTMGVPDSPDGYKLKPENLPEGFEWSSAIEKQYAEIAHKNNIPAAAMRELANAQIAIDQQRMEAAIGMAKENLNKAVQGLREEWKGDFDKNLELSKRVAQTFNLDPSSPGLTDPNVVKTLMAVGRRLSEDALVKGEVSPVAGSGKARVEAIRTGKVSDPEGLRLYKAYQEGDASVAEQLRAMEKMG
jgi:hypothetical protein